MPILARMADVLARLGKEGAAAIAVAGAVALVVAAVVVFGSFKAVAPSDVCVVRQALRAAVHLPRRPTVALAMTSGARSRRSTVTTTCPCCAFRSRPTRPC